MAKWHARNDTGVGTLCDPYNRHDLVLVVPREDFRKRIASDRCGTCEATMASRPIRTLRTANMDRTDSPERFPTFHSLIRPVGKKRPKSQ
jgi:hypothetical protein